MNLEFGLSAAIPAAVSTAWGARLIFPDDLLHDRQDIRGDDTASLIDWLNKAGALRAALANARSLSNRYKLSRGDSQKVILYSDDRGVVVANPNSSHGYLYVAAWLHDGDPAKQPEPEFTASN